MVDMDSEMTMIKKLIIAFALLLGSAVITCAQNVRNITVRQENNNVIIGYSLSESADVSLYVRISGKEYGPLVSVSGDVGQNIQPGYRMITWYPLSEPEIGEIDSDDIKFLIEVGNTKTAQDKSREQAKGKGSFLLEGIVGLDAGAASFSPAIGVMLGYMWDKIGAYAKFASNFGTANTSAVIQSSSTSWMTGNKKYSYMSATAGVIFPLSWISPYVGAGYGSRTCCWEKYSEAGNTWALVEDYTYKGLSADIGAIFQMGSFALSGGCTIIVGNSSGIHIEPVIGLGVIF